jgi:hypothetical protein
VRHSIFGLSAEYKTPAKGVEEIMESLRVASGVKMIEVNDAGECICIPMSDATFFQRFADLINSFQQKQKEIEEKAQELAGKCEEREEDDIEIIREVAQAYSALCRDICVMLDGLFGEGCCRKVFIGVETPGIELIGDFFEAITPLMQKFADERRDRISLMYNGRRKGAKSR